MAEPSSAAESLPGIACLASCDETRIRQVFTNLLQNAAEAAGPRGLVRVTLVPGSPVEIRIEDNGPGIPPDKVARIFEPFYTDKERGVGMGLAICMRLVNAHDGTIQVSSRPGGGTTMTVRIPAAIL